MINNSSSLIYGQKLIVEVDQLKDRIKPDIKEQLLSDPYGVLIGYKMVDANQFGLVLKLNIGITMWFFEFELTEVVD